jgi:hypothetical protein
MDRIGIGFLHIWEPRQLSVVTTLGDIRETRVFFFIVSRVTMVKAGTGSSFPRDKAAGS